MANLKHACVLLVLCIVVSAPITEQAMTCNKAAQAVSPCIPYLEQSNQTLTTVCCSGLRGLNSAAKTTADRRTACNCLKRDAKNLQKRINSTRAATLSEDCGVRLPFNISVSVNCSSVI